MMEALVRFIERLYGVSFDEWERIVTRTWVFLTLFAVVFASVVLVVRIPRTRIQRASLGLCLSYSMIVGRVVWQIRTGEATVPQPWALGFWTLQALLALYFIVAMTLEWGPPVYRGIFRRDRA